MESVHLNANNRIKELRNKKGLTLRGLSKATGIPDNSLSQYENGKRKSIPIDTLKTLTTFFNVSDMELQGYGYSKDHIFNLLYEAYKDDYEASYNEEPFTPVQILTREVVNEYLINHHIKPPKEFTLDFFKTNFAWLLDRKNVKRLLTTKDKYSDNDIKDILLENLVFSDSLIDFVTRIYGKQERK